MEDASQFLYEQVADNIVRQIHRGTFKPGERIPSVRMMTEKLGLSLSTVLEAYHRLEDRGILEARPQSGFYVRLRARELPPPPSMTIPSSIVTDIDIADLAIEVHENNLNPNLVPLGTAVPSNRFLPTKQLNRMMASLGRRFEEKSSRYEPISGDVELRRQIAQRSIDWGGQLTPEEIVVTTGATEALNLCLRAVASSGDTVAIESPTYYGVLQILESLNVRVIEIPTDPDQGISLESLETILDRGKVAALLVQPNFHNPLGCCMPDRAKKLLVELMTRKCIPVIEDDTYGDLVFRGTRPRLLKSFDRRGYVLSCLSFSKTLSPGFRLGWTAPGRFLREVRKLKMTNSISSSTLPQMALAEMLSTSDYDRYIRRIRQTYRSQMAKMIDAAKRYFPEGTKVSRPGGGVVLWVEFPRRIDTRELYRRALLKNVSVLPGELFSPKSHYNHCIRLNCGHPWSEQIDRAMVTLGHISHSLLE